jgi:hypothetical protein
MAAEGECQAIRGLCTQGADYLKLCGWEIHRSFPKALHRTQ